MAKKRIRTDQAEGQRLRKRIAIRILILWEESGYAEPLTKYALKASKYLHNEYPEQYTTVGYEPNVDGDGVASLDHKSEDRD